MSLELLEKLNKNTLTTLGTVRMNEPQIPHDFKFNRKSQNDPLQFSGHNTKMILSLSVSKAIGSLYCCLYDWAIDKETKTLKIILSIVCKLFVIQTLSRWLTAIFFIILNYPLNRQVSSWLTSFSFLWNKYHCKKCEIHKCNKTKNLHIVARNVKWFNAKSVCTSFS